MGDVCETIGIPFNTNAQRTAEPILGGIASFLSFNAYMASIRTMSCVVAADHSWYTKVFALSCPNLIYLVTWGGFEKKYAQKIALLANASALQIS